MTTLQEYTSSIGKYLYSVFYYYLYKVFFIYYVAEASRLDVLYKIILNFFKQENNCDGDIFTKVADLHLQHC